MAPTDLSGLLSLRTYGPWAVRVRDVVGDQLRSRYWAVKVGLAASVVSIVVATPNWDHFHPSEINWEARERQADDPFTALDYPSDSHAAKLAFRLVPPLIAHVMPGGAWRYLVIHAVFGVLLLVLVALAAERATRDRVVALLVTLATATAYAGSAGFWAMNGPMDAHALAFLVLAIAARPGWLIALSVFLACFSDERAALAIPLVALFHVVDGGRLRSAATVASGLGLVAYGVGRALLAATTDLHTASGGVGLDRITKEYPSLPLGGWSAIEGLWLLIAVAALVLWLSRRRLIALTLVALVAGSALSSLVVADVSRSATYVLPAAFVALVALRQAGFVQLRELAGAAMLLSLVSISYYVDYDITATDMQVSMQHPLPVQVIRWWRLE
ncbi:MAG TPA: hypothetical protein VFZ89_16460 [Solirubrobacteraceae bacterium]